MEPTLQTASTSSQPRMISLPDGIEKRASLLGGPPETASMRCCFVELMPGESMGLHTTGENEEILVTLTGNGELRSPGTETLPMDSHCVIYNPPNTPHDVVNTGHVPLKYIYIVARA